VRKSERACNPQTSTAANRVADYEALITCAGQLSRSRRKATAQLKLQPAKKIELIMEPMDQQ